MSTAQERRDALVERLFADSLGAAELLNVYVGNRLGLYDVLREGPRTVAELARDAGIAERYAREWLEQQAAAEILEYDEADGRFALPAGHDEALTDVGSLNYVAPFAQLLVACVRPIDALLQAFRSGGGVPYAAYGADLHDGQGAFTRPIFTELLASEWLPGVPELHARLAGPDPVRVADVACGIGWSSIAMARGYPSARVDGIDADAASIDRARENLAGSGVEDRVRFLHRDAADHDLRGEYDLVTIFEALHDMSYPVDVLRACRDLLAPGGSVLIGDERVADEFALPAGPVERFYYAISVLHCLPVGMVGEGAAGTGTVMRAGTVERYARDAGFAGVERLGIDNDFWQFYLLTA
jgi:SAM-dependent methyltransferase